MKHPIVFTFALLFLFVGLCLAYIAHIDSGSTSTTPDVVAPVPETEENGVSTTEKVTSPRNATYLIQGTPVTLTDGSAMTPVAPGSATQIVTSYFGNEVTLDLDGDGREDSVFILTQETGGSGIFFYVVAARNTDHGYVGSNALFLGDRIAPQTTEVDASGRVVVNYADRAPGESFATAPSVGKSMWLQWSGETQSFGEVVQDFEGEADPARMTLGMKPWTWVGGTRDGAALAPRSAGAFVLTFNTDGSFSARTDCNTVGGKYTTGRGTLTFGEMMSTLMYCDGSQEGEFTSYLSSASAYTFTGKGELRIVVSGGELLFR